MQPRLLREPIRLAGPALLSLQSDERLVRLARDGHPPAFAAIVDRHRPGLLRYCRRLVGEGRAEDAVQQTLANAHRAMTERDTAIELRPWLYRIAHNAALNMLRQDTEGWSLDDPAAPGHTRLPGGVEDLETAVARRERLRDTLSIISSLPARQRDALVLRELEGRSHDEIARTLGISPGAARQHIMRARAAVRAAATAITPYPLATKVAAWLSFTPTGERATQVAAGAGLGAGLVKVSAGLLATGAIVGGAVGTGATLPTHPRRPAGAAVARAPVASPPRSPAARPAIAAATPVPAGGRGVRILARAPATAPVTPVRARTPAPAAGRPGDRAPGTATSADGPRRAPSASAGGGSPGSSHDDGAGVPAPATGDDQPIAPAVSVAKIAAAEPSGSDGPADRTTPALSSAPDEPSGER